MLLIEDNVSDERLTRRALQRANILNRLEVVRDGVEAIDFIYRPSADGGMRELPAVTLLDLKLPRIDGLEVLRRIREDERTRLMPVVVMTSSKEEEDILAAYQLGSNAYLRKPVDVADFVVAARVLGLSWLLMNEPPPGVPS